MNGSFDRTAQLNDQASDTLRIMAEAATSAGRLLLKLADERPNLRVKQKSAGDFVSNADKCVEEAIAAHLERSFPGYGWLGEEGGERPSKANGLRWIVDPLDGTTNFLKGLPHWAVSIGLYKNNTPLCAIIHDPIKAETFSAERDKGAYLNGRPISVSKDIALDTALLATGVPSGGRVTHLPHCLRDLDNLMPETAGIRRWGAAALDLAYVAAGRLDAYWERNLGPWDIAAGMLLVKEAGGDVWPLWSGQSPLGSGSFLAGHATILQKVLAGIDQNVS